MSDDFETAFLDDVPWPEPPRGWGNSFRNALRDVAYGEGWDVAMSMQDLFDTVPLAGRVPPAHAVIVTAMTKMTAGPRPELMLAMLSAIAFRDAEGWSWDIGTGPYGVGRAAIAEQARTMIPLLSNADARVRELTAFTLAEARAAVAAYPALRARWEAEEDPAVRATLIKALSVLDPGPAVPLARSAAADDAEHPRTRVAAAEACVLVGEPWTPVLADAATAWLDAGIPAGTDAWETLDYDDGINNDETRVILRLAGRDDLDHYLQPEYMGDDPDFVEDEEFLAIADMWRGGPPFLRLMRGLAARPDTEAVTALVEHALAAPAGTPALRDATRCVTTLLRDDQIPLGQPDG